MNRSIEYGQNSSAHFAIADDETKNHSSEREFFAAAYRDILLEVWDDDEEMRKQIEDHIKNVVPKLISEEEYKKKSASLRLSFDGTVHECSTPEKVWFFRDEWNLFECVVEYEDSYYLFVWQTTE